MCSVHLCSNTTQPVRVDRSNMSKRYLSDFKRRCYEDQATATATAALMAGTALAQSEPGGAGNSAINTTEEQEMNDIQS